MRRLTSEQFIYRAKEAHGNKYNYDKVEYIVAIKKVIIKCPTHGQFLQLPSNHLKWGCKKCAILDTAKKRRLTTEEFVRKAKNKHGNKYDYSPTRFQPENKTYPKSLHLTISDSDKLDDPIA